MDAVLGVSLGGLFGAIDGPQDSMMEVVKSKAGKKALENGISFVEAVAKTSAREISKIGSTFVEETLTSITSWIVETFTKYFGGW